MGGNETHRNKQGKTTHQGHLPEDSPRRTVDILCSLQQRGSIVDNGFCAIKERTHSRQRKRTQRKSPGKEYDIASSDMGGYATASKSQKGLFRSEVILWAVRMKDNAVAASA